MFCNFICFIEQSTWNEILPLSKSVPKPPPISARPEFQAQVKRSSQVLKSKHLLQQERKFPHCWLRCTDKTRQGTADEAKSRVKVHLPLFKTRIMSNVQVLNMWLYQNPWKMALEVWRFVLMGREVSPAPAAL